MPQTITIQKSVVAMQLGLKKSVEQIAAHYGVTEKEMKDVMVQFGLAKARKPKNEPAYTINAVNDVDGNTEELPTIPYVPEGGELAFVGN
jgi:hypothetical protein